MSKIFGLVFLIFFFTTSLAQETCSRVAFINYQEVLVDASSGKRGEGLRYYLNKDPVAKSYLDQYQSRNSNKWQTATIGTAGTLMLLTGVFRVSASDRKGLERVKAERFWVLGGGTLIALNLLLSKTLEMSSEDLLQKSVEEYNKRNLPRIYLGPVINEEGKGIVTGLSKEF